MKNKLIFLTLAAMITSIIFAYQTYRVTHAQGSTGSTVQCSITNFDASVDQGPSKGLALHGKLDLSVDADGSLTGVLTPAKGDAVKVVGQSVGRAINMAFDIGKAKDSNDEAYIFGVGTFVNPVKDKDCNGSMGGPLVGPLPGDSGDWACCQPCPDNASRPGCLLSSFNPSGEQGEVSLIGRRHTYLLTI